MITVAAAFPYLFTMVLGVFAWWFKAQEAKVKELEAEIRRLNTVAVSLDKTLAVVLSEYAGLQAGMAGLVKSIETMQGKLDNVLYSMAACSRDQSSG